MDSIRRAEADVDQLQMLQDLESDVKIFYLTRYLTGELLS
jgi:hypothetical protein